MSDDLSTFVQATPSNLNALAPGCFAQIVDTKSQAIWVEIENVYNGTFTGIVHTELNSIDSHEVYKNNQRVSFPKDCVQHLGCNRYCFCD